MRAESFPRLGRDALARFQIPKDAFVVGTVAAVRPVKGIDILMRAAQECSDLPDMYVLVIGPLSDSRVVQLAQAPGIRDHVRLADLSPVRSPT